MAVVAVAGGFLLGFLDFVWIRFMPSAVAHLGNSSAVWAVAAFWYGYRARAWRVAAGGAAVGLVVAVPSYYLAATLVQDDDLAVIGQPSSLLWMAFGVLAGVVFGVAGAWARTDGWRQVVGAAAPGAVLFAEAALLAGRVGDPSYGTEPAWQAALDVALGVLVVVLAVAPWRRRLQALAAAVPLAVVGVAAFVVAGFG
ncbi:hypothetical protein Voc01_060990 [Virgisporangium ochraceum]|uniref:Uncharacterized protein n=2 Tax=Virgisporangium ochraceum TaxID=65505 RepID=A0A8J3ZYH0_9ACTN|nr:hypothetical protein Voc01_060990 [Virgisporangium ochraceum]